MSRMRLVVMGATGQVSRALQELRAADIEVVALGRQSCDLSAPASVLPALRAARPNIIVNAAAYTAVDQAESEPDMAYAVNELGARAVALSAAALNSPLIHLSTDYVFDGAKSDPYVEADQPSPINVYGASKLAGERAIAAAWPNHIVLRTSGIYGPHGANFVKTMLRLAETRDELKIVNDQRGKPTASRDIAEAIAIIARSLTADPTSANLRGVFHLCATGEASWAEFAGAIFAASRSRGGPGARVLAIPTAEYPTPAARPRNSRLDCAKIAAAYGVHLPDWRASLDACLDRLIGPAKSDAR
jgi:dTDP-4-dehydrorhamnose reductase